MSTISPVYRGDCNIEEVPGSKYTRKRGVSDVLTRTYQGNASLVPSFLLANPVLGSLSGSTGTTYDYEYTYMVLTSIDVSYEGPEAKLNLLFQGYNFAVLGSSNNLQQSGTWEPRSVYLQTDNTADPQYRVNYYSPTLTYKYVQNGILDTPIYQGASRSPSTITILDSSPVGPTTPNYVRQGNFVFTPFSVCTSFRFDQKGLNFDYQETWVVVIQPTSTSGNGPLQLSISGVPAIPPTP